MPGPAIQNIDFIHELVASQAFAPDRRRLVLRGAALRSVPDARALRRTRGGGGEAIEVVSKRVERAGHPVRGTDARRQGGPVAISREIESWMASRVVLGLS